MIVMHIGLPKTTSTMLLSTLIENTDVILIRDIYSSVLIKNITVHVPYYLKLSDTNKIKITNRFLSSKFIYSEATYKSVMKINFRELDPQKIYFIKYPQFIIDDNYHSLVDKIQKEGHLVKIIVGVRNLIDCTYSLHNHFKSRGESIHINQTPMTLYKNYLSKFYENIDEIIEKLQKYDHIIYNFDNLLGYTNKDLVSKLFEDTNIKINIPADKLTNVIINHYKDTYNLKSIKNYEKIENDYYTHLKNIIILAK